MVDLVVLPEPLRAHPQLDRLPSRFGDIGPDAVGAVRADVGKSGCRRPFQVTEG